MSNLAYRLEKKQQVDHRQIEHRPSVTVVKKGGITKGEVILLTLLFVGIFTASIYAISNYAAIYNVNNDIQEIQAKIDGETRQIENLQLQATELKEPDRILNTAKKEGMVMNEENVKLVSD